MAAKKKSKKSKTSIPTIKILYALGAIVLLVVVFNVFQINSFTAILEEKQAEAKEAARAGELSMIIIANPDCSDCFDIQAAANAIKSSHVNITSETTVNFGSPEASDLILKYGIDKIPSIVLTGETEKGIDALRNMELVEDALVFNQQTPPYAEASTGNIVGRVTATTIEESTCETCFDISPVLVSLKDSGVVFVSEETLTKENAQDIITKYGIEILPVVILSSEVGVYPDIDSVWAQIGTVASDGSYITNLKQPPYYDLTEGRVVGEVTITFVVDESCETCYDPVAFHKPILTSMKLVIAEETTVDSATAEGQALIDTYNLTKLPTLIISGDVDVYPALVSVWPQVGTVNDGAYVFRNVEVAGKPYIDLRTGEVVQ